MKVLGYSERGMINSLFYGIKYSPDDLQLFNDFLSLASFPYRSAKFQISDARVMIDQSFSDFGDADSVILVDNQNNKRAVFVEAKVKTFQKRDWSIDREFEKFRNVIRKGKIDDSDSSNLFIQLYYKVRLVNALRSGGIEYLKRGVEFPPVSSKKKTRKIGNNVVVLRAAEQLVDYGGDVLFTALVPDDVSNLRRFYQSDLKNYYPEGFQEWDITNWGYLSWKDVEKFCEDNKLDGVKENFVFNKGQIYYERRKQHKI
jgi:hypothetical protein